ncbi:MAG: hydrogenase [Hydrogenobaculum sp.]
MNLNISLSEFVEFMAALSLFFAILQTASHRLDFAIKTYTFQSLALSITMFLSVFYYFDYELIISAVLTLLIKAILIPNVMKKITEKIVEDESVKPFINFTYSILICVFIVIFSFYTMSNTFYSVSSSSMMQKILAMAVAIIFVGIFLMFARKKALIQVIGFLTLENGIILGATSTVKGLPLIVEVGVFFDVFVGAIMAGILIFHIKDTFDSLDTSKLSDLKE